MNTGSIRIFLFYRQLLKNPRALRWTLLVLGIVLAFGVTRTRLDLNIYHQNDAQVPSTVALQDLKHKFGDGLSMMAVVAPQVPDARLRGEDLCRLGKVLARNTGSFNVFSFMDVRKPWLTEGRLHYDPVLPLVCGNGAPVALAETVGASPWAKLLTDKDARDFVFDVTFVDEPGRPAWIPQFDKLARELRDALPTGFGVRFVGRAASQWYYQKSMVGDLWVHGVMLAGVTCLFRLFFGTWLAGLLFNGTLAFTFAAVLGLMGLSGSPVDVLNNGLFLITTVAAVEDFIFLSCGQFRRTRAGRSAFMACALPALWTSITTFVGFASLTLSPMMIVRRFGAWAAAAAMIEWLAVFVVLPALLPSRYSDRWVDPARSGGQGLLRGLTAFTPPRWVGRAALALLLVGAVGYQNIKFKGSDSPFGPGHPMTQAIEYLARSRGWEAPVYVLFLPAATAEEKAVLLKKIRAIPAIEKVLSRADIFEYLSGHLDPTTRRMVEHELGTTQAAKTFEATDGSERAVVFFRELDLAPLIAGIAAVRAVCGDRCAPVGELVVSSDYAEGISRSMKESFMLSAVLVAFTLAFLARRFPWRTRLILILTSLWGPLALYALIWLGRLPVDLLSGMIGAVLVGVTGDNAVQFLFGARRRSLRAGIGRRALPSAMVAVVTTLGSLALCLLSIAPLQRLGAMVSIGFALSFVGDLILLRANLEEC